LNLAWQPLALSLLKKLVHLRQAHLLGLVLLYSAFFAVPLTLILPIYTRVKFRIGPVRLWFKGRNPLADIRLGALWFAVYLVSICIASYVIMELARIFHWGLPDSMDQLNPELAHLLDIARSFFQGFEVGGWVFTGFVVGIFVPILEEAYFRGCLYSAIKNRWGVQAGITVSSLLFALLHLNLILIPVYLCVGIITASLYQKRGNLLAPVTFHSLNNLSALVVLLITTRNA
jgi:membrane protease YdiL (CAAX protease family)